MLENDNQNSLTIEILTEEQKTFILNNWDKMGLIDIVKHLSGDAKADGRHKLGRLVREFLANRSLKVNTTKVPKKGEFILDDSQKEFIANNADKMKITEIINLLFPNEKKSTLSSEGRAIISYIKEIKPELISKYDEPVEEEEIEIPKSVYRVAALINKYVQNPKNENLALMDPNKLTGPEERCARFLLSYLKIPRFEYQANQYKLAIDRNLFVSTFVRYLWNKPDTPQEELDQFIALASEVVTTSQIERSIQRMEAQIEMEFEANSKVSISIIDYINEMREKLDKSKERQKKLYDTLVGSRSKRLDGKMQENASVWNLVEAFQNEKKRTELLELAEKQKKAEEKDLEALNSMDAVIALLAGVSKDEFLN